jgi:acyl-CoA synthetase (AMP-forming)/AMP-acid ligase II
MLSKMQGGTERPPPVTLPEMVQRWANERPDNCALIFLGDGENETERLTFGELGRHVAALASDIGKAGLQGKPVLLMHRPGLAFVVAFCACLQAGAIAVPVPHQPRTRSWNRIGMIARHSGAVAILGDETGSASQTLGLPKIQDVAAAAVPPAVHIRQEDEAFLQYTSGSTGTPKGVIVTHRSLAVNLQMLAVSFGVHDGTRMVTWLPMFHDMGLVTLAMALYHGIPSIVIPPAKFIQRPARWLAAISRYRGTLSGGPNFAFEACVSRIEKTAAERLDLESWECAFCGAEPIRAATLSAFARRFGRHGFRAGSLYPAYGLAEATLIVSGGKAGAGFKVLEPQPDRPATRPLVSCGQAVQPGAVMIVDPATGAPVPDGNAGELWITGPHIAAGYWGEPSLTKECFHARLPEYREPFLRTGDLGLVQDGELYISGRLKDMMIVQGSNLYPEDIETIVHNSHPAFAQRSAAFSIDLGKAEQVVVVQEVQREHLRTLNPKEAADAAVLAVAEAHGIRLHEMVLVAPGVIPRTTSGKVQRLQCRELYQADSLRRLEWSQGHSAA